MINDLNLILWSNEQKSKQTYTFVYTNNSAAAYLARSLYTQVFNKPHSTYTWLVLALHTCFESWIDLDKLSNGPAGDYKTPPYIVYYCNRMAKEPSHHKFRTSHYPVVPSIITLPRIQGVHHNLLLLYQKVTLIRIHIGA